MTNPPRASLESPWNPREITSNRWKYDPPPRFMPDPTPGALNELSETVKLAAMMGWDLQPWQRRVIRVATEYELGPNHERLYKHRDILITVPRQCGKTTLVAPVALLRALLNPRAELYFSAQLGQYAGEFMKKLGAAYDKTWSPVLRHAFKFLRSNGQEGFRCTNGAIFQRFTRGEETLHSKSPLLVVNDEIWKMTREQGAALIGAVRPAQATFGRRAQTWYMSTMGTIESEFLNNMIESGRSRTRPDLCYIEYALDPEGDPTDSESWWTFHPALGNIQDFETLKSDFESIYPDEPAQWERAYCNRLTEVEDDLVFPDWDHLPTTGAINPKTISFALEHSARGYAAAVSAAWTDEAGEPHIQIVRQGPYLHWIAPTLRELMAAYPDAAIWIDDAGANRRLLDMFEDEEDFELTPMNIKARQIADTQLFEAGRDLKNLHHPHDEALTKAANGIALKTVNGVSRIDRDKSASDPMSLIAAAIALYGATHPADIPRPMVFV